jgi:8-oxo-dGTP diphosphatase
VTLSSPESNPPLGSLTRVIACVISNADGDLLICQRPPQKRHGGLWEFPGGKIEADETPFVAARRELEEELGVSVTAVGDLRFSIHDPGSLFVIEFYTVMIDGNPHCLEHTALEWVRPNDLLTRRLAPSDRRFAESFLSAPPVR